MFLRMTRLHFDDDRYGALLEWADSVRPTVEAIDGFRFAHIARTGVGEGMVIAAYDDVAAFERSQSTVEGVMAGMADHLTSPAHTHAGSVDASFGGS